MPAQVGKRYIAASGAELIITKGADGTLQDGDTPLNIKEDGPPASGGSGGESCSASATRPRTAPWRRSASSPAPSTSATTASRWS